MQIDISPIERENQDITDFCNALKLVIVLAIIQIQFKYIFKYFILK